MSVTNNISTAFNGSAGLTKEYYEALVFSSMAPYRASLNRAQQRQDELEVKKAVYNDLDTKLSALYEAVDTLRQPELSSDSSVFDSKKVTSSDSSFLKATATSSAITATYNVHIQQLAEAHQVWGNDMGSDFSLDLGGSPTSTITLQVGGDGANQIDFTVEDGSSLSDIAQAINSRVTDMIEDGTIEEEYGVQATIVDNRLTLTSVSTGTDYEMSVVSDADGVLATLGVTDGVGFVAGNENEAQQAIFDVNGITGITRNSNTGIDDVLEGVSFDLLKAHTEETESVSMTVAANDSTATSAISSFVGKFNDLMTWLKNKTTTQETSPGVYSRGSLSDDYSVKSLRSRLLQTAFATWGDAPASATYNRLDQVGISLGNNLSVSLDSSELSTALASDYDGVVELFDTVMGNLESLINPYTEGTDSLVDRMKEAADGAMETQGAKVTSLERGNSRREEVLRDQIARQFAAISSYNDQGRFLMTTMYSQFG